MFCGHFTVQGPGFSVQGLGFRCIELQGLGFKMQLKMIILFFLHGMGVSGWVRTSPSQDEKARRVKAST